jgi:hypothetical protein
MHVGSPLTLSIPQSRKKVSRKMQIFRKFHSFFGFDFLISAQYMEIHKKM